MSRLTEVGVIAATLFFSAASYAKTATMTSDLADDTQSTLSQKTDIQNNSAYMITELNMDNYDPASTEKYY